MSTLAKIGVIAGGCAIVLGLAACSSSDTTGKPASGSTSAAATAPASAAATVTSTASTKPAASGADISSQPMGTAQIIKTAKFDAKVTLTAVTGAAAQSGDAPYVVEARVQVTRGTYPAGTLDVQFIYANGSVHKQIEDSSGSEPTAELDAPGDGTFRYQFEHPAGAGVGQGARITINEGGKPLATWLT
ncbi:hypothetical protein [Actinoplanes sp. NPDC020271]|uniref:hypothetical protein n=1 Tax=Actinoplanes sp. NPDC020271 TaxID=3363896 RepID=UPI00379DF47F